MMPQQRQQNVQPEMAFKAKSQKYAERWQQDGK